MTTNKVPAIVFPAINEVTIGEVTLLPCGESDIVCETVYTFVSPGTELRVLGGHYTKPEDFPLVPGYSAIARVVEVGAKAKGFRVGDLVSGRNPRGLADIGATWGGQCSRHVYATTGEDCPVLLPQDCNPLDYTIAEVAAISLRGVLAAAPKPGETAVIIGQGMIGAFSAAWLLDAGCRVIVCDLEDSRLEAARKRGVAFTVNLSDPDAEARLKVMTNGGADIVVEASGSSEGALLSYKLVRKKPQNYSKEYKVEPIRFYHQDWPRLIMQANYLKNVEINPFGFMPGEGVTILAPKDRGVEDRQMVVEAIRTGRIKASDYLDQIMSYKNAKDGYAGLLSRKYLSVVYEWN